MRMRERLEVMHVCIYLVCLSFLSTAGSSCLAEGGISVVDVLTEMSGSTACLQVHSVGHTVLENTAVNREHIPQH